MLVPPPQRRFVNGGKIASVGRLSLRNGRLGSQIGERGVFHCAIHSGGLCCCQTPSRKFANRDVGFVGFVGVFSLLNSGPIALEIRREECRLGELIGGVHGMQLTADAL